MGKMIRERQRADKRARKQERKDERKAIALAAAEAGLTVEEYMLRQPQAEQPTADEEIPSTTP
jgi:hypothetical protein